MTSQSVNPIVQWVCGTVLLLAILTVVGVLAWHGTLTGTDVGTVIVAIIGIAGGAFSVHAGVTAATKNTAAATGTAMMTIDRQGVTVTQPAP